ncbi:hypothetical protein DYE48_20980, partial [Halobacillus trueperi]
GGCLPLSWSYTQKALYNKLFACRIVCLGVDSPPITMCIKAANSESGFEILKWQRGGGEWRDSCGKKVHGETPQSEA